jgi:nitrate/TMAO reductase-like tetraheme cytochrome c subunit
MRVVWFCTILFGCTTTDKIDDLTIPSEWQDTITVKDVGADVTFSTAKECGACHPAHLQDWEQSMHAYAAHSPVFDAMAQKAFRDTSGEVGTFCTSCHSPIGAIQGEDGTVTSDERSEISKNSVSCEVCHSAVDHSNPVGNLSLKLTATGEVTGPYSSDFTEGHESVQSDFVQSAELCGSCHDVFNYPGLRIEEAYTEYTTSPAKDMGLSCQDCHMGSVPGVPSDRSVGPIAQVAGKTYPDRLLSSHRFIGPDYSLLDGFPYPDDPERSQIAQEEMFSQITVLLKNAVELGDVVLDRSGTEPVLKVTMQSLTTGHNVPTGFTSERQLWLDVVITNVAGTILFSSGQTDFNGDLYDTHSWEVAQDPNLLDAQLVNLQSKNKIRYGELELPTTDETVFPFDADYIEKHSLRPMETRTALYVLPQSIGDQSVEISVSLKYRNLPPYILRALQLTDLVERLQVFTIDSTTIED